MVVVLSVSRQWVTSVPGPWDDISSRTEVFGQTFIVVLFVVLSIREGVKVEGLEGTR